MNRGLILEKPVPRKDYVFGSRLRLGGLPLVADGQWDRWLPADEVQNLNGIEPMACTTFGTLNCVEALERQEYGDAPNYSDRFLALACPGGIRRCVGVNFDHNLLPLLRGQNNFCFDPVISSGI